jgi:hypothetical protein
MTAAAFAKSASFSPVKRAACGFRSLSRPNMTTVRVAGLGVFDVAGLGVLEVAGLDVFGVASLGVFDFVGFFGIFLLL